MSSPRQSPTPGTASLTFSDRARRFFGRLSEPATRLLARWGVTPNLLTVVGALANLGVGLLAASGNLALAGGLWLAAGLFDGLDGALARRTGTTSSFGAFLDSTLDRYSDAFVLTGLLWYTGDRGQLLESRLAAVALVGTLLISYTRARAESLSIACKVGLLTRLERFLLVAATLITQQVTIGLIALSILTHLTVLQRILHVRREARRLADVAKR
jgi:CDP-diacylglycerol--glycerol-3-phosphate 3-phosphatidyltransferase